MEAWEEAWCQNPLLEDPEKEDAGDYNICSNIHHITCA
jgi:hypothetical protein